MRITKPKRGRRAAKRLDLTDMREVFRDRRLWAAIGVVVAPSDGAGHFEQTDEPADVLVEVVLQPSLIPVTCRLPAAFFCVPDVGEEVAVLIPEGAVDFMPTIVCLLSSNKLPSAQGPDTGRIAIVRDEVVVHDGTGGAVSLALKSDVDAIKDYLSAQFDPTSGHTHKAIFVAQPTNVVENVNPSGTGATAVALEGTSVLKGK